MTPAAVVFDFDGLVMDSEWVIYEAAAGAFTHHGHHLEVAAWATIVGINDEGDVTWWQRLCEAAGVDGFDRADFDTIYEGDAKEELRDAMLTLPALPGVEVLVDSLTAAGVPIGVASSSSTGWLERNLDRLGLIHRFGTLVGSDAVGGVGKPDPAVYLKACADLGAEPARSVALEDSAHGVTAAKAAAMVAVAVPSRITRHNDFAHADLVVDGLGHVSVDRLASLVDRVGR